MNVEVAKKRSEAMIKRRARKEKAEKRAVVILGKLTRCIDTVIKTGEILRWPNEKQ